MPRGSRKDEHRGGRKAGVPNKASSSRIERAERDGRQLPPEGLLQLAEMQLGMVQHYQPKIANDKGELVENPKFDEERYGHWMREWRDTLTAAAPYYAPKLHVMAAEVHHRTKVSISQPLDVDVSAAEAMQAYIKLIDAKPL
jgi:hypothetical protein